MKKKLGTFQSQRRVTARTSNLEIVKVLIINIGKASIVVMKGNKETIKKWKRLTKSQKVKILETSRMKIPRTSTKK